MPGIDEKLMFRGVVLIAIVSQTCPTFRYNIPLWIAPFTITTGLFTLGHLFSISEGHVTFYWMNACVGALPIEAALAQVLSIVR